MLTGSSSSYLGQDYLQPFPTTLDAKNSPLALLAATCNNIGKDDSAKAIIPPIQRKDRSEKDGGNQPLSPERSRSSKDGAASASPKENVRSQERPLTSSSRHQTLSSPSKRDHSSTLDLSRSSPARKTSISPRRSPPSRHSYSSSSDVKSSSNNVGSRISVNCGSLSVEINHKENHGSSRGAESTTSATNLHRRSSTPTPPSSSSLLLPSSSSAKVIPPSHHTGLLSTYYPHLGLPGYALLPPSPLNGSSSLLAAAAAHKLSSSDSSSHPHIPVTYATVKTASGASTLVPICADPYCVQCKLSVQSAQLAPASAHGLADCNQCSRDKLTNPAHSLTAGLLPHALHGSLPGLGGSSAAASAALAALYGGHSHASDSHRSNGSSSGSPSLVCSWVGSGKYCGEKFSSSEELMTHLRSHTSSLEQSGLHAASLAAAAAASSPYASLNHAALGSLGHLYPPTLSPNSSLRSAAAAYPGRSISPSSLFSASSRFHPYLKSPLVGAGGLGSAFPAAASLAGIAGPLPTSAPPTQLGPLPSALYSLHGSRLGPLVP